MEQRILHFPRLDTILSVENLLKKTGEALSKNEIDRQLPKQIMRPTLNVILNYLEESGKIAILKEGIIWIYRKDISKKLRNILEKSKPIQILDSPKKRMKNY